MGSSSSYSLPGLPVVTLVGDDVHLPHPLSTGSCQMRAVMMLELMGLVCRVMSSLSPCPPQIIDLTTELSDERYKGDVACQVLDGERAERLRGARELQELQVGGS